ncbi:MAG: CPBP family intramembrane metalloprotease [Solobacterium sp.]|nr:CPBP family intramembrane metalloprotease [Solobacterium sp.]
MIDKYLRACRKWTDIFLIAGILSVVVTILAALVGAVILKIPVISHLIVSITQSETLTVFMRDYLLFIGIWVVVILIILIFPGNRPMLKAFGFNGKKNTLPGLGIGLLLGFCANGFCVLMSCLMKDIKLSYFGFEPLILIAFLISVFIQSGAEELADRLYLYQKLRRRYKNPWVAILFNALVFMSLHLLNPGFTALAGAQIFIVGVVCSLFVYYYDGLWIAIGFHTAWNYTQNLIFGLPNSGIVSEYSIFTLEAASARNGLFYNVNFGVEGSIGASIVIALIGVYMIVRNKGKKENTDYWADMEAEKLSSVKDDTNS